MFGDQIFGLEFVVRVSRHDANNGRDHQNKGQHESRFIQDGRRHDFSPFSRGFRNAKSNRIIRYFAGGARKNRVSSATTTPGLK
jgi:hypothetical protein